jgi:hypothetical protein
MQGKLLCCSIYGHAVLLYCSISAENAVFYAHLIILSISLFCGAGEYKLTF